MAALAQKRTANPDEWTAVGERRYRDARDVVAAQR
jgi:hypothetical protein